MTTKPNTRQRNPVTAYSYWSVWADMHYIGSPLHFTTKEVDIFAEQAAEACRRARLHAGQPQFVVLEYMAAIDLVLTFGMNLMPTLDRFILLAQQAASGGQEPWYNSGPTFFFTLMGICLVMIIVGAVVDRMPEKEKKEGDEAGLSEEEKQKARREAKAKKKKAKYEKKLAKSSKKSKKGQAAAGVAFAASDDAANEDDEQASADDDESAAAAGEESADTGDEEESAGDEEEEKTE
ncbi:MAG: hypothetical protein VB875_02310 [Pirellulales bacterium]